jgi:hypothetical protein
VWLAGALEGVGFVRRPSQPGWSLFGVVARRAGDGIKCAVEESCKRVWEGAPLTSTALDRIVTQFLFKTPEAPAGRGRSKTTTNRLCFLFCLNPLFSSNLVGASLAARVIFPPDVTTSKANWWPAGREERLTEQEDAGSRMRPPLRMTLPSSK